MMKTRALDLWTRIGKTLQSEVFARRARQRPPPFTRRRQVGWVGSSIILNWVRRSPPLELYSSRISFEGFPHQCLRSVFKD